MPDSDAGPSQGSSDSQKLLLAGTPKRFRSVAGVRRFVAQVLWTLERGGPHLTTDTARVMLYGAKILQELISQSDIEERLAELEARVARSESQPTAGVVQ